MQSYLKLVRFPNLLMIAFTMYAIRWGLIYPMLSVSNLSLQFSELNFFLLVLSTVLITAAGYGINDYFDVRADKMNRPDKVVIGKTVKRRVAMVLHWTFNIVGILLGVYISVRLGYWQFSLLFLGTAGLLWHYSTTYKRQFLIGNLIVAGLTGMVPMLVLLYEIPSLNAHYHEILIKNGADFMYIVRWVIAFAIFAFITTLIRELVKDIEDFEGDRAFGRHTLPVVLGINTTRYIVVGLIALTIGLLYSVYFWKLNDTLSLLYISIALVLPLVYLIVRVLFARRKEDYSHISLMSKFTMLGGILYLAVAYYNFTHL